MAITWKYTEIRPSVDVLWYEFSSEELSYLEKEYKDKSTGFMEYITSDDGLSRVTILTLDDSTAEKLENDQIAAFSSLKKAEYCEANGITRFREMLLK